MSERNKFRKYKIVIDLLYKIIIITPKFLLRFIWNVFDNSEGKLALLFRYLYLKKYCFKIGENVFIGKNVSLKNIDKLSIGSDVSIHAYNYLDAFGEITIGDNVSIANHCTLISSDHTWEDIKTPIKYNAVVPKSINIEEDVWIAAGCRILGNVNIQNRVVVGAGAVVNKNLATNSLYVGVPARKIKTLNDRSAL